MPQPRPSPRPPAWDAKTLRDPHGQPDKAVRVQAMFDAIAPTYERVNAVASLGRDAAWRARTVEAAEVCTGDVVLDLCCGTGDMVRAFARHTPAPRLVLGLDFSAEMLRAGRYEPSEAPIALVRADALRLPLADNSVDVITCAFGVRNFSRLQTGLEEMHRVARPGARVCILEFTSPANPLLAWGYRFYCERVLPLVARLISRERVGAYQYLARSIRTFEPASTLARRLEDAGFSDIRLYPMNLGGVVLYRALRP